MTYKAKQLIRDAIGAVVLCVVGLVLLLSYFDVLTK